MNKIHISLSVLCLTFFLHGCIDDNSRLVRFWNDGFIITEKENKAIGDCSREANRIQARDGLTEDERYKVYVQCMIDKGYKRRYKSILKSIQEGSK